MRKRRSNVEFPVYGQSPLGYNGQEATATGFAAVRNTEMLDVPLVYDKRVGSYLSKQSKVILDDKKEDLRKAKSFRDDEAFRHKAGFR